MDNIKGYLRYIMAVKIAQNNGRRLRSMLLTVNILKYYIMTTEIGRIRRVALQSDDREAQV